MGSTNAHILEMRLWNPSKIMKQTIDLVARQPTMTQHGQAITPLADERTSRAAQRQPPEKASQIREMGHGGTNWKIYKTKNEK